MPPKTRQPIQKLFIANRGEIARRIASTASRMGITTVVATDRLTPPSFLMGVVDEFYQVDDETTALYLDQDRMIAIAKETRCDALHPGFGFLSENDGFAARVIAAGINWVGPKPDAIAAMASKAKARDLAIQAKVPCLQGLQGFAVPSDETGNFQDLERFAREVGLPLLIKAAYGGGGKGMRIVQNLDQLKGAALRAYSEAKSSFGDGTLICEQYLENPRHVEVQILADQHGGVIALGDRDCSIQRRHQKIIEEAPAPDLEPALRQQMHTAAVNLAAEVGYNNAGTVEFLVAKDSAGKQKFYFLEMNTRLQVEHTVTEEVFGIDLVEWQLRIAAGEPLDSDFKHRSPRGHSFEVRLYGEDPEQNFLPAPGWVPLFEPAIGPGVRWEIGLERSDEITGKFDPMFAKLVVTGADRLTALDRLGQALLTTGFCGGPTNLPLLHTIVTDSSFREGPEGTHFLEHHGVDLAKKLADKRLAAEPIADFLFSRLDGQKGDAPTLHAVDRGTLTAAAFGAQPSVSVVKYEDTLKWQEAGRRPFKGGQLVWGLGVTADSNTVKRRHFWYARWQTPEELKTWCQIDGWSFQNSSSLVRRWEGRTSAAAGGNVVTAPVPGKVIQVKVGEGDTVECEQVLFVLESMKMEFEVKAQAAGIAATLKVKEGDQVAAGDVLISLQDGSHEN